MITYENINKHSGAIGVLFSAIGLPSAIAFFWNKELAEAKSISIPALNWGPFLLFSTILTIALLGLALFFHKKITNTPSRSALNSAFSLKKYKYTRTTKAQFNLLFGNNWNARNFHELINPEKNSKKISNYFSKTLFEAGFKENEQIFDFTYDDSFVEPVVRPQQSGFLRISPFIAVTDGLRILMHDRSATDTTTVVKNPCRYDMFGSISATCGKMLRANLLDEIIQSKIVEISPIPGLAIEEIEYTPKSKESIKPTESSTEFCVMQGIMVRIPDLTRFQKLPDHLEIWDIENLDPKKLLELTAKSKLAINFLINITRTK